MTELAGRVELQAAGLVLAHWVCSFLFGYIAVELPWVAASGMLLGMAVVAFGMHAAVRNGRRGRVAARFALVGLLLALGALLGFAAGAGTAANGSPNIWAGLGCTLVAWLIAVARGWSVSR